MLPEKLKSQKILNEKLQLPEKLIGLHLKKVVQVL